MLRSVVKEYIREDRTWDKIRRRLRKRDRAFGSIPIVKGKGRVRAERGD